MFTIGDAQFAKKAHDVVSDVMSTAVPHRRTT
jgi:hypothetical protein